MNPNLINYSLGTVAFAGIKNNLVAIAAPTVTADITVGYSPGSVWINTISNTIYVATSVIAGAANWVATTGANSFTVDTRTTTAETVIQADSGGQIKATNAAAIVLTIPAGLVSWQGLAVVQGGAGAVTATAGAGVTLLSVGGTVTTNGQNAVMAILPSGIADAYYIAGNVV